MRYNQSEPTHSKSEQLSNQSIELIESVKDQRLIQRRLAGRLFVPRGSWSHRYIEYNHACILSLLARHDGALKLLAVVDDGWNTNETIINDSDFDLLRAFGAFNSLDD